MSIQEWRCFHCGEVFTDAAEAALHFGKSMYYDPACQIDVASYRAMEEAVRQHVEEDTTLHRQIYALDSKHSTDLRREEEKGYARGLKDYTALEADNAAKDKRIKELEEELVTIKLARPTLSRVVQLETENTNLKQKIKASGRTKLRERVASLEAKVKVAEEALDEAITHLDYCGYGDSYERECAKENNLPERLEAALAKLREPT